jgi:N-acetyltransferase
VTLSGRHVVLRPLDTAQIPALARAGRSPEVWRYLRIGPATTPETMTTLVEGFLRDRAAGEVYPFAVCLRSSEQPVGILRYFHIDRASSNVEIGTWLAPEVWRTPVNTEAKWLSLRHAFETEGLHRVTLKTHEGNDRSARAIARIGGVHEGTIREHILLPDGRYSSSVVFSILAEEWPQVRSRLEAALARPWSGTISVPADG